MKRGKWIAEAVIEPNTYDGMYAAVETRGDQACDEAEARGYARGVEAAATKMVLHREPCARSGTPRDEWCILCAHLLPSLAPTTNSGEIGSKLVDEPAPSLLDEVKQEAARSTFVCPCPGCMNPATYGKDGRLRCQLHRDMEKQEAAMNRCNDCGKATDALSTCQCGARVCMLCSMDYHGTEPRTGCNDCRSAE